MNSISTWLCSSSTKNLFVKIVHPGGHVELHDRPIIAAELLNRNPKCCVAHPTIFQQPYAIVPPETTLVLGQKYYVVPLGTIRKLQLKYPRVKGAIDRQNIDRKKDDETESSSFCWLFRNNNKNDAKEKNDDMQNTHLGIKIRASSRESSSEETKTESSSRSKRDSKDSSLNGGHSSSRGRISLASMDNWQPGLKSINEE